MTETEEGTEGSLFPNKSVWDGGGGKQLIIKKKSSEKWKLLELEQFCDSRGKYYHNQDLSWAEMHKEVSLQCPKISNFTMNKYRSLIHSHILMTEGNQ